MTDVEGMVVRPRQMAIVWGDSTQYWAVSEAAAQLRSVCWFNVECTFPAIPPGEYQIAIKGSSQGRTFVFNLRVQSQENGVLLDQEQLRTESVVPTGFLSSTFVVPEGSDLTLTLYNHAGQWKSGLSLTSLELVPLMQRRFLRTKRAHAS